VQLSNLFPEHELTTDDVCKKIFSIVANNYNQKQTKKKERMFSAKGEDGRVEKEVHREISRSTNWVGRFIVIFLILFVCTFVPEWGFKLCLKTGFEETCRRVWGRELGLLRRAAQRISRLWPWW